VAERSSMATLKVGTGNDAPVSNSAEVAQGTAKAAQQNASDGKDNNAAKPLESGIERVKGFKLRAETEARARATLPQPLDLPDIADASFGSAAHEVPRSVLETVHGPDDRVKITNTGVYPWRAHASLLITARDGSMWIGTGWFIGPHTLMTAGHVVYIKNSGVAGRDGFVRSINVMAGRNGSTLPYGTVTASNFRTVRGWVDNGDEDHDYGAIILPTNLGSQTGWFGFGVYSDATLKASVGNISGYPGDKPDGTQWYAARRIDSVGPRKVYYDIDTYGGQSGSCVYRIVGGNRYAFAVHAYGGATTNSGTRIVTPVYNNMVAWKA
jgi:glutamyl endopeptidase